MGQFLQASPEAGRAFYQQFHDKGTLVMLNLLKFRTKANYSNEPALDPSEEITGAQAYQRYLKGTLPILKKVGGRVIYFGKSHDFLIGPIDEKWDALLLVEYPSMTKFMELAQSEAYQKVAGHRTAALEDSRLLPSNEMKYE